MPQPLSRVNPNAGFRIGNVGDDPLQRHPELALLAVQVVASWSNVDAFLLRLFVELMGGPRDTAATVFLALETQSAKTAAINAVARALPDNHQRVLRAILAIAKTHQRGRDKIAHWIWGDSDALPEAILLIDPRAMAGDEPPNRDDIYVYRRNDFIELIRANERVAGFGMDLRFILMGHVANRDGALYARLCAEPEIQERLRPQA